MIMKLNRRRFFGVGAGAVVAAPQAAREVSSGWLRQPGLLGTRIRYGGPEECSKTGAPLSQADWIAERRGDLEKIISGQFSPYDDKMFEDGLEHERLILARVETMRSPSAVGRMAMAKNAIIERRKQRRIDDAKRELADLLKPKMLKSILG